MNVRCARTVALVVICIATLSTTACTENLESATADLPVTVSTSSDAAVTFVAAAAEPVVAAAAAAEPVPVPTTPPVDAGKDGRSAATAVPIGTTLLFHDRNAVGDKGAVTVLGIKDWDGTGPGDDSGVAIEVELTLAPDAFIPVDSIVTTEPWTVVDKSGGIYRASWLGSGDPTPVYPHRMFIKAGETARGWILIGSLVGVDDGSRPSKTALTIRYELSGDNFLFWRS